MRKTISLVTIAAMTALLASLANAATYPIGQMKLSGIDLEIEQKLIVATGKASLIASDASIRAGSIRIDLAGKGGGFAKGTATGNVVIHAKQTDKATGASQIVDSTSDSAVMAQGQNNILLKGNVVVKITYPEQMSAPGVITGDTVTVFLNENKIRVKGSEGKPAELTATLKENPKSQTGQK